MMMNPYASPVDVALDADDLLAAAKRRLSRPATALIVMSSIQSVFASIAMVTAFVGGSANAARITDVLSVSLVIVAIQFSSAIIIAIGAAKMGFLKSYRWAQVGAFIACIPFLTPFGILGIPFGIWSLYLLSIQNIKTAFLQAASISSEATTRS